MSDAPYIPTLEPACSGGVCDLNVPEGADAVPLAPIAIAQPVSIYDKTKADDIRKRRCGWFTSGDMKTDALCADACGQLELAQAEVDRLTATNKSQSCEIENYKKEIDEVWELVAAHSFPEEYSEIDREDEED